MIDEEEISVSKVTIRGINALFTTSRSVDISSYPELKCLSVLSNPSDVNEPYELRNCNDFDNILGTVIFKSSDIVPCRLNGFKPSDDLCFIEVSTIKSLDEMLEYLDK